MAKIFSFIKKFWREISILVLFIVCFASIRSCRTANGLVELQRHGLDSAYHYATNVTLKNGTHVFRIKTLEATVHQLRGENVLSALEISKLKSDKIEMGDLSAYYRGLVEAQGTIALKGKDSIIYVQTRNGETQQKIKSFKYDGNWLQLRSVYNPITDSLSHRYLYRVEFTLATYRKRQGLFKRSILLSDVSFNDPSIQVGEFTAVKVVEPPKRFYETRLFVFLIGVAGGAIVTK
jgi:hypothetical protein